MTDFFTLILVSSPLVLLLLQKPFGLVSRFTRWLDSLYVFVEGFSLYKLASYFILVGTWAFFLMYSPQVFSEYKNPLLADYLNGHWVSWLILVGVVTYFGHFDIIRGVYIGAFIYSIHELSWIVTDAFYFQYFAPKSIITLTVNPSGFIFENVLMHYWPLMIVMAGLLVGYFVAWRGLSRRKEVLIITIVVVWDILWLMAGFHTSVNNFLVLPKTSFYTNPNVNVVEILGWVLPSLAAMV